MMRKFFCIVGGAAAANINYFDCAYQLNFYSKFKLCCSIPLVLLILPLCGQFFSSEIRNIH